MPARRKESDWLWSVTGQAANLGVLALIINRWQGVPTRQRHELSALAEEIWTSADEQPPDARLHDRRKRSLEFSVACGLHNQDLPTDGTTRFLQISQLGLGFRTVRVMQRGDDGSLRNQLVQQP